MGWRVSLPQRSLPRDGKNISHMEMRTWIPTLTPGPTLTRWTRTYSLDLQRKRKEPGCLCTMITGTDETDFEETRIHLKRFPPRMQEDMIAVLIPSLGRCGTELDQNKMESLLVPSWAGTPLRSQGQAWEIGQIRQIGKEGHKQDPQCKENRKLQE